MNLFDMYDSFAHVISHLSFCNSYSFLSELEVIGYEEIEMFLPLAVAFKFSPVESSQY